MIATAWAWIGYVGQAHAQALVFLLLGCLWGYLTLAPAFERRER